jgi:hypothetical protein
MRTKVTLVLVFLNVALFFFIFRFERRWRTEDALREARRLVLGPEAANIRTLEVTLTAGGSYSLQRDRDAWFLTKPLDRWPANEHAVSAILHGLQLLEHETSFAVKDLARNNQTLADFSLDKPRITVAFTSGDPAAGDAAATRSVTLRIGDATPDGKRLYVLSPDGERVHVVNRTLADSLTVPAEQLRSDVLFGVRVFEARSLSVQIAPRGGDAGGVRVRIRRDGTRWTFDAPITARASRTALELAINDLNALRARSFPATPPAQSPSANPTMRLALEGNNRVETLFLGEPVASAAAAARPAPAAPGAPATAANATEFHAQLEGRRVPFTVAVPDALLEVLRTAQEELREKRVLDFEPAAVTALSLSSPLQPNLTPFELKRIVDTPAGAAREATRDWQLVRRGDNPNVPRILPADPAAVQRLLAQLAALSAQKFKSDAPTSADLEEWGFNRPVRELVVALGGGAAPLVLRLGTDAARNVYARVGTAADPGNSIYQVGREILDELPLAPHAWRDRAVTDPLPAAARIAALKLTDLETRAVLYETSFNAAGEPATAPRDLPALRAIVAALRALRAREYVAGGFTERVTAAGEDRPWRFQLDTTIAGPGSAAAEQTSTLALFLTERIGGSVQYGGLKEQDTVFRLEQPFLDALWTLIYGPRDPGPRPAPTP